MKIQDKATLNDAQNVALACIFSADNAAKVKKTLEEGEYEVDFVCRIRGSIKKGAPHSAIVAQSVDPWRLIAILADKLNKATLNSIVSTYWEQDEKNVKEVKIRVSEAMDAIKRETQKVVAGRTTAKLTVEPLES